MKSSIYVYSNMTLEQYVLKQTVLNQNVHNSNW